MEIISDILAVIGIATSVYSLIMLVLDRLGYYSWFGIEYRSKKLIKQIEASGFTPDIIVGLGRSGGVLGGILAGNLGVKPLAVIDRMYEWENDKTRKVVPVNVINLEILTGKKILLVDAAPHTGETCKEIRETLLKAHPAEIKIASLFKGKYTVQVPDFYINEVEKVKKMPWRFSHEYREDFTQKKSG
jgi:uncharacterized protein